MRTGIDARLAKLEARQPQKGRTFWLRCMAGDDREEILRNSRLALGPDDTVNWIEIVLVHPPDRPPWNEHQSLISESE